MNLLMVWPQSENTNSSKNCYCHSVENEFSLGACAHDCGSEFDIEAETIYSNFVFFRNISKKNFLVHFICVNQFCIEPYCHQESFVASYYVAIGKTIVIIVYKHLIYKLLDSQEDTKSFDSLKLSIIEFALICGALLLILVIATVTIVILSCTLYYSCKKLKLFQLINDE